MLYNKVPGEEEDGFEDDTPYQQMQEEPHYGSLPQEEHVMMNVRKNMSKCTCLNCMCPKYEYSY